MSNLVRLATAAEDALVEYMTKSAVYDGHTALQALSALSEAVHEAQALISATYVYESQTYHKARIKNLGRA